MNKEQRALEYLAKAKEAEERAESASGPASKEAWTRIARNYHELAKQVGRWA
jgi:hypothetical protein